MRRCALFVALIVLSASTVSARDAVSIDGRQPLPLPTVDGTVLTSTTSTSTLAARSSAGTDTFDLYGGPLGRVRDPDGVPGSGDEYVEGRFEDPAGVLARGLSAAEGDWTGVDLTEQPIYWQVDTFNAANLNDNGPGNRALWCGLSDDDPRAMGWETAPGYGNGWNQRIVFEQVVDDPSVGQTVDLDFVFNADTEPGYDFLTVSYETFGSTRNEVYSFSGTTPAGPPGVRFADVATAPITYAPDDYARGDRIRIVIGFRSDGAWSDEDGQFESNGAVQVDDIVVTTSAGTVTEGFEGPAPYLWTPERDPFFGDFANVFAFTSDIDPCRENRSPQVNFVDFGQAPPNGPGVDGTVSTGGSTSSTWDYGSAGGHVVNHTGGISGANLDIHNQVWSPEIDWDLPGPEDDGVDVAGLVLAFDVWRHLPGNDFLYYQWGVRFFADGAWTNWRDYGFVYGFNGDEYVRSVNDVTSFVEPGTEKVQIALGVISLCGSVFGFPCDDASPAPWFDDVRLSKVRIGGPSVAARTIDLANDAFPVSGSIDASTPFARDALDVRFDMARSIAGTDGVVPGDSVLVDVAAVIPGSTIEDVRMVWSLRQNPRFEPALRTLPFRPGIDVNVTTGTDAHGRTIWSGEVVMDSAVTTSGVVVPGRWAADLPDTDFLYPGDLLHYSFRATDDAGRTTTLPADLDGFGVWDADGRSTYSRTWTVRALPTLGTDGAQPDVLLVNDGGRRGQEDELIGAFEQNGYLEGRDFDTYTVQGAVSGLGNGIGAAGNVSGLGERRGHGATLAQVDGYGTIVYTAADVAVNVLGTGQTGSGFDPSADVQLLTAWKDAPGRRATVTFGDNVVSSTLAFFEPGPTYVNDVLGVDGVAGDLTGLLAEPTTLRTTSLIPELPVDFAVYGLCPWARSFDQIVPRSGAVATHAFLDATDTQVPGAAAGVLFDRTVGGDRKVDLTFPFGIAAIVDDLARTTSATARVRLLGAALDFVGAEAGPLTPTNVPSPREVSLEVAPNPFNPTTTVTFTLPRTGVTATVRVYDVRGQLVRTLYDGAAATADLRLDWDGRDARGAAVASGVYFVRARTDGFDGTRKVALVE